MGCDVLAGFTGQRSHLLKESVEAPSVGDPLPVVDSGLLGKDPGDGAAAFLPRELPVRAVATVGLGAAAVRIATAGASLGEAALADKADICDAGLGLLIVGPAPLEASLDLRFRKPRLRHRQVAYLTPMGRRPTTGRGALGEFERYLERARRRRAGLGELERESTARSRQIARLELQAHLRSRGDGDVGDALVLEGPDGPLRLAYKKRHTRRIVTIVGELTITRVGYAAPGRPSIHPLDAELELPARSYSYEVQRHLARAAVCGPFDEAVHVVAELTGVVVPKRSAEQIILDAAADVDSFYERRAGGGTLASADLLVGAIDCKGIPMVKPAPAERVVRRKKGEKPNKKKMATVAAVFACSPRRRTPDSVVASLFCEGPPRRGARKRPKDKRVWASLLAGKDNVINEVREEMTRRDPDRLHTWVIVTDGERALQRLVTATFTDVTLVLDLLHVMEKLWKVGNALHAEGSPEAIAFVRERARRVLCGEVSQVVKGLRSIVTKRGLKGEKAQTLTEVANYLYANRQRMRYDLYLKRGWPIASGAVEGACKCLVRDRFERSGMRWTPHMAEAMLKLRAVYLSGDWDAYWHWHIQQDQLRLYRKDTWLLDAK